MLRPRFTQEICLGMIKVGLIGYGEWGKILFSMLNCFSKVLFICNSSDNWRNKVLDVEWVFIATPNETHYEIVADCLAQGVNVFCEKPLTLTCLQSERLYEVADKHNVELYVDDIQSYNNKRYSLRESNYIERKKFDSKSYNERDLLYRLAYHDIYMLFDQVKNIAIEKIKIINTVKCLHFFIFFKNISIEFFYDVEFHGDKVHRLNDTNLLTEGNIDPLMDMLMAVVGKNVDFKRNREMALFSNNIIDQINEKF